MKKTILITGASSGIGKETAKHFQAKGWNVVATMRIPENEKELTTLENVLVTKLDVLDLESIDEAISNGLAKFGKIDVLLNNAGYGAYGPLESFTREKVLRQFNTNVIGLMDVTRAILPHFRKNKSGIVINISSMGGKMTFPLGSLYHGTKFAVEGISESFRYEMEQIGCKVKIVEPGAIATDFGGRSFDFYHDENLKEYNPMVEKITKTLPELVKNAAHPRIVSEVIYQAATDGKSQLRYMAGKDAKMFHRMNKLLGYNFIVKMNKRFFKL